MKDFRDTYAEMLSQTLWDAGIFDSKHGDVIFELFELAKATAYQAGREEERNEWLAGNRCSVCGDDNRNSRGLSDVCSKCIEEQ